MRTFIALTLAAFAATASAEAPKDESSFLQKAAQGQVVEIETGELAQNRGTSDAVKRFGAMMVQHHTAARDKIEALARRKGVEIPAEPSEDQQATMKSLQATTGPRFDAEYMAHAVAAHEKTVEMLKAEIASGRDPDTRQLAQELLPTVESHLAEAYRLTGKDPAAAKSAAQEP